MDDVKEPTPANQPPAQPDQQPASGAAQRARPRRRWLKVLLYLLAAFGLVTLLLLAVGVYRHATTDAPPPRVEIDEAAVIDNVMSETYGKYSAARKGWVYVDDNNVAYLMQVVQQTKIPDDPAGDELYFVASGVAVDGSDNARFGAFYVRPTVPHDGNLTQSSMQVRYASTVAVRPEQVYFEALSDKLWGWVIKTQTGADASIAPITVMNNVLAPHDDGIAMLGEFMAARDFDPGIPCAEAKAAWDIYNATTTPDVEGEDIEEAEEPLRCDKRRWTYRMGVVNGSIPVPITVTAGGLEDGQPVEARKWKVMFDPKSFTYTIPPELAPPMPAE